MRRPRIQGTSLRREERIRRRPAIGRQRKRLDELLFRTLLRETSTATHFSRFAGLASSSGFAESVTDVEASGRLPMAEIFRSLFPRHRDDH